MSFSIKTKHLEHRSIFELPRPYASIDMKANISPVLKFDPSNGARVWWFIKLKDNQNFPAACTMEELLGESSFTFAKRGRDT